MKTYLTNYVVMVKDAYGCVYVKSFKNGNLATTNDKYKAATWAKVETAHKLLDRIQEEYKTLNLFVSER